MAAKFRNYTWQKHVECDFRGPGSWSAKPITQQINVQSALAVTVNGGADAFGVDTLAAAVVDICVVDRGLATFAVGKASFTAVAAGPDPDAIFASTYAAVDIAGADVSHIKVGAGSSTSPAGTVDVSTLQFAALDLKFDTCDLNFSPLTTSSATPSIGSITGNLATFDVTATAIGTNSYVDVAADALALEDELSTTAVSATAAVDGSYSYAMTTGTGRADCIIAGAENALVLAGGGNDLVRSGEGEDWLFGQSGNDKLYGGGGGDTLFGGSGSDRIDGGDGADWIFGGTGCDDISGGADGDILYGGASDDRINGGAGDDILFGGDGCDIIKGGDGSDAFRLGEHHGDGDDTYYGESGADLYLLMGDFDRDVIMDFSIADGDRVVISDQFRSDGLTLSMQRSWRDRDDLVITFEADRCRAELTLDEFFRTNLDYDSLPRSGKFTDAQVALLIADLTIDSSSSHSVSSAILSLQMTDMLSLLG